MNFHHHKTYCIAYSPWTYNIYYHYHTRLFYTKKNDPGEPKVNLQGVWNCVKLQISMWLSCLSTSTAHKNLKICTPVLCSYSRPVARTIEAEGMRYKWLMLKEEGMEAIELGLWCKSDQDVISLSLAGTGLASRTEAKAQFFDLTHHSLFEFTDEIYFGRYSI